MIVSTLRGIERVNIEPGEYHASNKPIVISTLLGSCVACCLYDNDANVFGMNHFLLANPVSPSQSYSSSSGRYGIHAMELLINSMLKLGAKKQSMKAKCFGGGDILEIKHHKIGKKNVAFIKKFLETENIPIIGSDLGDNVGRLIHFFGEDYSVYVKRNDKQIQKQIIKNAEELYLEKLKNEKNSDNNQLASTSIEIW